MNGSIPSLLVLALGILLHPLADVSAARNLAQRPQKSKRTVAVSTVRPQSRYVAANGIRIHYLEWGKGQATVILLHGLFDSAEVWSSVAPLLSHGYRVIAPDRRGAGLTDKPATGYDYQTLALDVEALIVSLNAGRVHLVGHSAGAGVALTVAASAPEKIRTLVLVDGGFWPKRPVAAAALPAPPCDGTPAECGRKAALESGERTYDPEFLYPRVDTQVLLVLGVPAMPPPKEFAAGLAEVQQHVATVAKRKLRKGQMVLVKETGHWIQTDQPKALAMAIQNFWKRHAFRTRLHHGDAENRDDTRD